VQDVDADGKFEEQSVRNKGDRSVEQDEVEKRGTHRNQGGRKGGRRRSDDVDADAEIEKRWTRFITHPRSVDETDAEVEKRANRPRPGKPPGHPKRSVEVDEEAEVEKRGNRGGNPGKPPGHPKRSVEVDEEAEVEKRANRQRGDRPVHQDEVETRQVFRPIDRRSEADEEVKV
jgi:hypothetical protein